MRKFIKIISLFLFVILSLLPFSSCKNKDNTSLTFYAPDGAPALAISKFIANNENFVEGASFNYKVISSNDIPNVIVSGLADIIVLPVNSASKLYNKKVSDPYRVLSVITHGNLYIMSKESLSLENLKGKVVGVIGQGLVPDLTLKSILKKNGIEYEVSDKSIVGKVAFKYVSSASELIPLLKTGVLSVGLLGEPACSKLTSISSEYTYRLDVQSLYDSVNNEYPQAVLMVKQSVLDRYPDLPYAIKEKSQNLSDFIKQNLNLAINSVSSCLLEGITPSLLLQNITPSVVDNCKIYWQTACLNKDRIKNYINNLISVESLSATVITNDFFYDYE